MASQTTSSSTSSSSSSINYDVKVRKTAFKEVGNIFGSHLHDRHESELNEDMVRKIQGKLTSTNSFFHKDLVGINFRMEELINLLGMGSNEVRFIGICSMGGMGKTTLAQVVYNRIRSHFEESSFLANVRKRNEKYGLVSLQKQLLFDLLTDRSTDTPNIQWGINMIRRRLGHKKVLIILDDVNRLELLEALAGEQSWFGQGSRIIITTRDKHLLIRYGVFEDEIYELKGLNNAQSLKLFCQKAFKKDYPQEGYVEFCQKFVHYAKGHPLALEVLGSSFLFCRSPNLWESTLGRIKENPGGLLDVLKISFDGLEEREKSLFLNIACFFEGVEFNSRLTHILEKLYDKPEIYIDILQKKSLITITWEGFQMHDILQAMGRSIAHRQELGKEIACHRESPEEVARRSRL